MDEMKVNGIEYLSFEGMQTENLMSAVSKIYYNFYDVDLEHDSYFKFHASRLTSSFTDGFTKARECLLAVANNLFEPEYKAITADFYDSNKWPERLKDKDTMYLDARGIQNGWIRTNLIVAVRNEEGVPTHVIIALQGVNDIKLKEIAQTKQLEVQLEEIKALNTQLEDNQAELEAQLEEITVLNTQLEDNQAELEASAAEQEAQLKEINSLNDEMILVLKSMADIYYSMHLINLIEDTVVVYKTQDSLEAIVNHRNGAAQMMKDEINDVVVDKYKDETLVFTDLSTLRERMKDAKVLTSEFVGKHIGWTRASFITVKSDRDGRPVEVMFVTRCIDAEKKKEEALVMASNIDALTGLKNRNCYLSHIKKYRNGEIGEYAVAVFDINYLKKINDGFGHDTGDDIIKRGGQYICDVFQHSPVFRIGGDEYAALLTGRDYQNREELGRQFERGMKDMAPAAEGIPFSVSYGLADFPAEGADYDEVFHCADSRMYEFKKKMKAVRE